MMKLFALLVLFNQVVAQAQSRLVDQFNKDYHIQTKRGKFTYPDTDSAQKERSMDRELRRKRDLADRLAAVKYEIINGNLEKAKTLLLQAGFNESFIRPIQYRYLAMINFIEGNFRQSLEFLNKKEMLSMEHQDNVCLMRTLNYIVLDRAVEAQEEWSNCQNFVIGKSVSGNVWMNSLLELKLAQETEKAAEPLKGVSIENERGDFLRLFLKLALYLNKQELIFPRVPYLSVAAFENLKTRELLGLLYYRNGDLVKAYNLIEDLSTPNSENIKGNIYLAQEKLELAYAQFKLALRRKNNSQNALERIIPTAWRLRQWSEGADFVRRLEGEPGQKFIKIALEAAFLTKDGKHKEAAGLLELIAKESRDTQPVEVNQLYAYNALMLEDREKTFDYADKACLQRDGFNCWLRKHLMIWEDFTLLAKRDEPVFENVENLLDKYKSGFESRPIQEKVFINQAEIEELEDEQIELIPPLQAN